jgi:hypothetical protein
MSETYVQDPQAQPAQDNARVERPESNRDEIVFRVNRSTGVVAAAAFAVGVVVGFILD